MSDMKRNTTASAVVTALLLSLLAAPLLRAQDAKPGARAAAAAAQEAAIPPGAEGALERVQTSPRHGEWAQVTVPGMKQTMRAYVVYPEVKEKAPVVIVIHEIFGLSDWVRSVTDQLAADGFIAVAPDFLAGKGTNGGGSDAFASIDEVRKAISGLDHQEVKQKLDATRDFAAKLPASNGKFATIGFCWGGATSFRYAAQQPDLSAAVVYYGASPEDSYEEIKAPVLGVYGQNDQRVNATIERAQSKMKELNKTYDVRIYDNAGHGFLRQQEGPKDHPGANGKAAQQAWPETIEFLREHTK